MTTQSKDYIFAPQDLMNLLVHYFDGAVPLGGGVREIKVHPAMSRKVALIIESDEWEDESMLFLSYDGKRTATWTQGMEHPDLRERNETPQRQS